MCHVLKVPKAVQPHLLADNDSLHLYALQDLQGAEYRSRSLQHGAALPLLAGGQLRHSSSSAAQIREQQPLRSPFEVCQLHAAFACEHRGIDNGAAPPDFTVHC